MTPTLTRPRPVQRKLGGQLLVGAGVLATALVAVLLFSDLRSHAFVGRLTMTNDSRYTVQVDVSNGDRDGWLSLGAVGRESTRVAREVLDPGPTWVFRFTYAGRDVGELQVVRSELRDQGWTVVVPPDVADRLSTEGAPPSAF